MRGKVDFLPFYIAWIIVAAITTLAAAIVAFGPKVGLPSGTVSLGLGIFVPCSCISLGIGWYHVYRKTYGTYEEKSLWFWLMVFNAAAYGAVIYMYWWNWILVFPILFLIIQLFILGRLVMR